MIKIDEHLSLPRSVVHDAVRQLEDWFGVELTLEQCAEVIASSKILGADLYASGGAGDTTTRELLIDAVVHKLLGKGRSWPLNMDGKEKTQRFMADFAHAATKAGYVIKIQ